jgi:MFS family permease
VGAAAVGSTISVYAIARLMMNLPAGMLADRFGRKPLLVWGPLITALGKALLRCPCSLLFPRASSCVQCCLVHAACYVRLSSTCVFGVDATGGSPKAC